MALVGINMTFLLEDALLKVPYNLRSIVDNILNTILGGTHAKSNL
jgi:hypothetical protein